MVNCPTDIIGREKQKKWTEIPETECQSDVDGCENKARQTKWTGKHDKSEGNGKPDGQPNLEKYRNGKKS